MPLSLSKFSDTPETRARMIARPEDRRLAIGAEGALRSLDTTVLPSVEDTPDALRKAGSVEYRKPGARLGDSDAGKG
jgi:hypothetical protein